MILPNTCRHFGEAIADVAYRGAEAAEYLVLLLEQLHQVQGRRRSRRRTAGDEASAAFEREQRAVERFGADMLEHDVDTLFRGNLAHDVLEAVGAIIDDMVGTERARLLGLRIVADRGDHGRADGLCHLDRDGADAGTACVHQNGFAGLKFGIVE